MSSLMKPPNRAPRPRLSPVIIVSAGLIALLGVSNYAEAAPPFKRDKLTGPLVFEEFGVSVTIPREVIAFGPECDSNGICGSIHGFRGTIDANRNSDIQFYVEYSPSVGTPPRQMISLDEALRYVLDGIRPAGTEFTGSRSEEATVGGLAAKRTLVRFQSISSRAEMVIDAIVALRELSGGESALYEMALIAPRASYETLRPTFDSLIKSFKIFPPR